MHNSILQLGVIPSIILTRYVFYGRHKVERRNFLQTLAGAVACSVAPDVLVKNALAQQPPDTSVFLPLQDGSMFEGKTAKDGYEFFAGSKPVVNGVFPLKNGGAILLNDGKIDDNPAALSAPKEFSLHVKYNNKDKLADIATPNIDNFQKPDVVFNGSKIETIIKNPSLLPTGSLDQFKSLTFGN